MRRQLYRRLIRAERTGMYDVKWNYIRTRECDTIDDTRTDKLFGALGTDEPTVRLSVHPWRQSLWRGSILLTPARAPALR